MLMHRDREAESAATAAAAVTGESGERREEDGRERKGKGK
jgi:hypothetical protein